MGRLRLLTSKTQYQVDLLAKLEWPNVDWYTLCIFIFSQALRDDVVSKERPVRECTENVLQFLKSQGERLSREERDNLQQSISELRMRYERLVEHSNSRVTQLGEAFDYLRGFDRDVAGFEHWVKERMMTVEGFRRDAGRDINVLKKQSGQLQQLNADIQSHRDDLNKINVSGQGFLNNAKVILKRSMTYMFTPVTIA